MHSSAPKKKNTAIKHSLGTDYLGSISAGKDLRILGNIRLRMNQQCALPAKAQNILGCTNKSTSSRFRKAIMHFYSTLIALHLQYCDLLCPALPSEAKTLIKWREFSRGSPTGIQHSPYEEELREQDWLRLQKEQLWEHLTESPLQPPPPGHFGEVAKGSEAMESGKVETGSKETLFLKRGSERGCPERLWATTPCLTADLLSIGWETFWGPFQSDFFHQFMT